MNRKHLLISKYSWLIVLLFLGACKIPKAVQLPSLTQPIPISFQHTTADTQSIAQVTWQAFYTDTPLRKLIDTALVHNYDLANNRQTLLIQQAQLQVAKALTHPTLRGVLSTQVDKYALFTMNGVGNFDLNKSSNITPDKRLAEFLPNLFIGLRSEWEIDVWKKLHHAKKSAAAQYLASQWGARLLQTHLVAQIANCYYEWLGLKNELQVIQQNAVLQQNALQIVQAQKQAGRANELAVLQFQAQLHNTNSLVEQVKQQVVIAENQLQLLLGTSRITNLPTNNFTLSFSNRPMPVGVPSMLLYNRPDIQQAGALLTATHADVAAARARFFPSFSISPYLGVEGFQIKELLSLPSLAAGVLGNMTAPFYQQRQLKGQYATQQALAEQAFVQYQRTVQTAINEVQTTLQVVQLLEQQHAQKQQECNKLADAVNAANDLYANGYATYLEVITAQKSLLNAQLERIQIKKQQMQGLVLLYRATGGGWK